LFNRSFFQCWTKLGLSKKKFRAELEFGFFFLLQLNFSHCWKKLDCSKKKGLGVLFFCYSRAFFDDELKVEIKVELQLELELEIRAELKLEL
jgi:hypothetical protein